MNHNHKEECKHEKLTYCKECDVVECECGREWGKKEGVPIPQPYQNSVWCNFCQSWYFISTTPHVCYGFNKIIC